MPVVGTVTPVPWEAVPHLLPAFRRGLAEAGYLEGKNLAIGTRVTNYRPELLAEAMRDVVVRLKVNVIFAIGPEALAEARNAATSIPIVGTDFENDPVAKGYVRTLARPGGNITGMFLDIPELCGKQVGLLRRPGQRRVRCAIVDACGGEGNRYVNGFFRNPLSLINPRCLLRLLRHHLPKSTLGAERAHACRHTRLARNERYFTKSCPTKVA
jgi:ABC transporter substrate binding protein